MTTMKWLVSFIPTQNYTAFSWYITYNALWRRYQLRGYSLDGAVLFQSFILWSAVISIKETSGKFWHDWSIWNALSHPVNRSLNIKKYSNNIIQSACWPKRAGVEWPLHTGAGVREGGAKPFATEIFFEFQLKMHCEKNSWPENGTESGLIDSHGAEDVICMGGLKFSIGVQLPPTPSTRTMTISSSSDRHQSL